MNKRSNKIHVLPDVIIQHIQSFLQLKETAQTILVSKSWLRAWSTRPDLIFSRCLETINKESIFSYRYIEIPSHVIDRTLESYVERGMPIVRFHLLVDGIRQRWLKMARQSNVIEFHLLARPNWTASMFQEIFLTQSLQVLSIVTGGFLVVLSLTDRIKCVNLKKLELHQLVIDEVTFLHIMSSCPLIADLMLFHCSLIDPPSCNLGIQSFIYASEYASLKRLSLKRTQINDDLLQTLLSKSLQLENFNLSGYSKWVKPINLSSVTLKRVILRGSDAQLVLIYAPNLRKLKYESCRSRFMTIPLPVTIRSPVTKGMVKVTIVYNYHKIDESWFHRLRETLAKFATSYVKFTCKRVLRYDFEVLGATRLPPLNEVETLKFEGYNELPLLYAFFNICRPKIVLLDRLDRLLKCQLLINFLKDLNRGNLECCSFDPNKCWRHYVKDVKLYYVVDNEKKPLDMNGLETGLGNNEMITLALEWESSY